MLDSVVRALGAQPPSASVDLTALVRLADGAFPTEVRQFVQELLTGKGRGQVVDYQPIARYALTCATSRLPLPHPLDYEWRFSDAGADAIAELLQVDDRSDPRIALLGTPALAESIARRRPSEDVTLFEQRPEACDALRPLLKVVCGDVADAVPGREGSFAAAVADPPWYPAVTAKFIAAAAALLCTDGRLLLCVPGASTRPGLGAEREKLVSHAVECGLAYEGIDAGAVEYESPPFELAALEAAGLPGFDPFWRRGDLMRFRRRDDAGPADDAVRRQPDATGAGGWREVRAGQTRVRVDVSRSIGSHILGEVVPGDVLDSVSSRDVRRGLANVWTTTNRLFASSEPALLVAELTALSAATRLTRPAAPHAAVVRLLATEADALARLGVGR